MSKRKTFPVADIVANANNYFANAKGTRDARLTLQVFVADVLHKTGNYKGFRYLEAKEVPAGELPGIIRNANDTTASTFPDDSRISFYVTPKY
jgi:hypothetical protein